MPELPDAGRRPSGRLAGLLALLPVLVVGLGAPPSARGASVDEELSVARDFFLIADYASALDKLTSILRAGTATPEERLGALALAARCHVALGSRMQAIDSFCSGLQQTPGWRPGLEGFTEAEREAFAKAFELCGPLDAPVPRPEPAPAVDPHLVAPPDRTPEAFGPAALPRSRGRPWYRSPWILGGVGGVIAGVAVLSLGGEDSPPPAPLPDFPPPPE